MNNEKYKQIVDEAYRNYLIEDYKIMPNFSKEKMYEFGHRLAKEEFINKCKTDTEFSEKRGLKIEERELSLNERVKLYGVEKINTTDAGYYEHSYAQSEVDEANIPTKLITLTYNNEKIETYE